MGKALSKLLQLPFIDLDDVIEEQEGMKIAEIFSTKGEAYFRSAESAALRKQSEKKEFIMATGGGTPCFHDNIRFINATGTTVFLDIPIQEIAKRVKGRQKKSRPLLADVDDSKLDQELEDILQKRLPFYKQAHFTISSTKTTAQEIINLISPKK